MLSIAALGVTVLNVRAKRWGLAVLTAISTLVMSGFAATATSRGALIALAAGLFTLAFLVLFRTKGRVRIGGFILIALVVIVGVALGLNNPKVRDRVASLRHPYSDPGGNPRLNAWAGATRLWKSYPVIGVGANAFRFGYLQHKDTENRKPRRFAENEVLQILSEGGILGMCLSLLLLFSILRVLFRNIQKSKKQNPTSVAESLDKDVDNSSVAVCAIAVLVTAGAHSMFDFILHLPLYAIVLATIVGAGATLRQDHKLYRAAIILTLLVAIGLIPLLKPLTKYDKDGYVISASNDQLAKLLTWTPTNTMVLRRLAASIRRINKSETDVFAEEILIKISEYDPTNFKSWINLGNILLKRGDKIGAKECFDKATEIRCWAPVPKI